MNRLLGTALALAVGVFAFLPQALAMARWVDPEKDYGSTWSCDKIIGSQPMIIACKKCQHLGGRYYWRINVKEIGFCAIPSTQSEIPLTLTENQLDDSYSLNDRALNKKAAQDESSEKAFDKMLIPSGTKYASFSVGFVESESNASLYINSCKDQLTETAATTCAVEACNKRVGNPSACKAVSVFAGCGYIVTGNGGKGRLGWGAGPTKEKALFNCRGQGLTCLDNEVVGGCNSKPPKK